MDEAIQEQWLIFGGSRGLGLSLLKLCEKETSGRFVPLSISRKRGELEANQKHFSWDLAQGPLFEEKFSEFKNHLGSSPIRILYAAGGGPYGAFSKKAFKDHQWAFELNFLSPARLLHWALNDDRLRQFIYVGSQVAEDKPDPMASSYAASKHGMFGLIKSIQGESPHLDLRLFSPSYMDTDLLPKNAKVRESAQIFAPDKVGEKLFQWMLDPSGNKHYIWKP